jgi:hypothetical protein
MSYGGADIESLEILKDFRARMVEFDNLCRNALMGLDGEVKHVQEWLGAQQIPGLERQLRKCEEAVNKAQSDLVEAKWREATAGAKSSGYDERKTLERAKRRKEETEARLDAARRWRLALQQSIGKLSTPCNVLANLLEHMTPLALARLDRMLDNLEDYFQTPSGGKP